MSTKYTQSELESKTVPVLRDIATKCGGVYFVSKTRKAELIEKILEAGCRRDKEGNPVKGGKKTATPPASPAKSTPKAKAKPASPPPVKPKTKTTTTTSSTTTYTRDDLEDMTVKQLKKLCTEITGKSCDTMNSEQIIDSILAKQSGLKTKAKTTPKSPAKTKAKPVSPPPAKTKAKPSVELAEGLTCDIDKGVCEKSRKYKVADIRALAEECGHDPSGKTRAQLCELITGTKPAKAKPKAKSVPKPASPPPVKAKAKPKAKPVSPPPVKAKTKSASGLDESLIKEIAFESPEEKLLLIAKTKMGKDALTRALILIGGEDEDIPKRSSGIIERILELRETINPESESEEESESESEPEEEPGEEPGEEEESGDEEPIPEPNSGDEEEESGDEEEEIPQIKPCFGNTTKEELLEKKIDELKDLMTQAGIIKSQPSNSKAAADYLCAPTCNPESPDCPADTICDVSNNPGRCVPEDMANNRLKNYSRTMTKTQIGGKDVFGTKEAVEALLRIVNKEQPTVATQPQLQPIQRVTEQPMSGNLVLVPISSQNAPFDTSMSREQFIKELATNFNRKTLTLTGLFYQNGHELLISALKQLGGVQTGRKDFYPDTIHDLLIMRKKRGFNKDNQELPGLDFPLFKDTNTLVLTRTDSTSIEDTGESREKYVKNIADNFNLEQMKRLMTDYEEGNNLLVDAAVSLGHPRPGKNEIIYSGVIASYILDKRAKKPSQPSSEKPPGKTPPPSTPAPVVNKPPSSKPKDGQEIKERKDIEDILTRVKQDKPTSNVEELSDIQNQVLRCLGLIG